MSVDNVEVFRCKECSEIVYTAPAGFIVNQLELKDAEFEHYTKHSEIEHEAGLVYTREAPGA